MKIRELKIILHFTNPMEHFAFKCLDFIAYFCSQTIHIVNFSFSL